MLDKVASMMSADEVRPLTDFVSMPSIEIAEYTLTADASTSLQRYGRRYP
nr:hypothetical protein [Pantoea ananatis]